MAVDQSMAFHCIDHVTLLRKLRIYNLDLKAVEWVRNYLNGRTQFVTVGTANSRMQTLRKGVPQRSIIGPLLYAIYVNEMTEVMRRQNCTDMSHERQDRLFGETCDRCGTLNMYMDDVTVHIANRRRAENMTRLEEVLTEIKKFLAENRLHLNVGKTKILEEIRDEGQST